MQKLNNLTYINYKLNSMHKRFKQKLLKKMLFIEIVGEQLYNALSSKTEDENLKSVYQKLALGERQTAKYIKQELKGNRILFEKTILNFFTIIFKVLTLGQIVWFLRNILERRIYNQWFNIYNKKYNNQELWNQLLQHENRQRGLLKQFWDKPKEAIKCEEKHFSDCFSG